MEDRAMALAINILEMVTVTMDITMLDVSLMVEIVVIITTMDGTTIAQ
jgi:hypothetical protein